MPEKSTFEYIDNDPLVPVTLINPASNKRVKAIAYLDTGSDTVVIPRELWLKLGLEMLYRSNVLRGWRNSHSMVHPVQHYS